MEKVIIVDDEIDAIERMKRLLINIDYIEVVGTFLDSTLAFEYCKKNKIDIVYIDIEMPIMNGIEFCRELSKYKKKTKVVFATAYKEYSLDAFDVFASGFLVKPVVYQKLVALTEKILDVQTDDAKVSVKVCGLPSVSVNGSNLFFRTKKSEELFYYLIANEGKYVSKELIMDSLWRDKETDSASRLLKTNIYYLRKTLKDIPNNHFTISNKLSTYILKSKNFEYDLKDLFDLLKFNNDVKNNDIEERINKIIDLYDGEVYKGKYYCWIAPIQSKLDSMLNDFITYIYANNLASYPLIKKLEEKFENS